MTTRRRLVQHAFWWEAPWRQLSLPLVYPTFYNRANTGLDAETIALRAFATRAIEQGYLKYDPRTLRLMKDLRRMRYDDALYRGVWRLEMLYLEQGEPHYRLYWHDRCFGVTALSPSSKDLAANRTSETVLRLLAAYLVFWGWESRYTWCIEGGAKTETDENTDHTYRLFDVTAERRRAVQYDLLREREAI